MRGYGMSRLIRKGDPMVANRSSSINIEHRTDGTISPRKDFKTFSGMVWQLWILNKRYHKLGVKADYTVTLPLPPGDYVHKGKK